MHLKIDKDVKSGNVIARKFSTDGIIHYNC